MRLNRPVGLKEAKDQVDAYVRSRPALKQTMEEFHTQSRQGFLRFLLFLATAGACIADFVMQGK